MIERLKSLFYGLWLSLKSGLKIMSLYIHPTACLSHGVRIRRGSQIAAHSLIGEHSELYRHVLLGKEVIIGDYSSINSGTVIECGTIGNFCSIGVDVIIGPGEHSYNHITSSHMLGGGEEIVYS